MARPEMLERKYRQKLFKEIGVFLGEKRQTCGLKQADVAKVSGYSAQFISNIECGTAFPPPNLMSKMIEVYKISEQEFLNTLMRLQLEYYRETYFDSSKKRGSSSRRAASSSS
jgi:transcriptional regulator with XRE-family HTH domain